MSNKKSARVYDINSGRVISEPKAANDNNQEKSDDKPCGFIRFLRQFIFYVLMWLRGPVRFFLALVGFPTMIAIPIVVLGLDSPQKTKIVIGLVMLSFSVFMLRWLYDSFLMWLSPEPLFLNS